MRNLKKVLTLVLTVAMVLSIMVVGTGAAFSDQDQIKNTEAVDMCVSLNIIAGMEDGSYRPNNNVTRGQMCKMICVALNGGKEPTLGTNTTPTFNDVRTNPSESWAESFIESCYSQGIVSGVGGGRFNPGGSVTGTQAARMLLVALGYDADEEQFVGESWAVNVNTRASAKGLYDKLESIDANAALSRDNAAQMIWNALNAYEVEYNSVLDSNSGTLVAKKTPVDKLSADLKNKLTLLADKYEAQYEFGEMTSFDWNLTDKAFDYTVNGTVFQSTIDYSDLFGMDTKVSYTRDKKTQKIKVYGIVADDSKVVAEGVLNDIEYVDGNYIEIGGVKYRTDGNSYSLQAIAQNDSSNSKNLFRGDPEDPNFSTNPSNYILNELITSGGSPDPASDANIRLTNYASSCSMRAIDYDGNGRVDRVVYAPVWAAQVTSVGSKQITTNLAYDVSLDPKPTIQTGTYKFEDNNIYEGVAKDDYVTITPAWSTAYDETVIAKMDSITGSVTGTRAGKVQIDGTWYNNPTNINFRLGGSYEYSNIGSFVFYADQKGAASLNDILYVSNIANNSLGEKQAKVYLYDGTSATVTIGNIYEADGDTDVYSASKGDHIQWTDTDVKGKFYTYTVKNGEYNLTDIGSYGSDENQLGYKLTSMKSISKATSSIAGRADNGLKGDSNVSASFLDDAVVFISYNNGTKMKVVSGAVAKNYNQEITGTTGEMLYEVSGGNNRVVVAYLNIAATKLPSAKGESGIFAYVVDKPYQTTVDGTKVYAYEVWNGKGDETTILYEEKGTPSATKGSVISYTDLGDGMVEDIKANTDITNTYGTGVGATTYPWDIGAIKTAEDDVIVIDDTTYLITDNTTVLFVDTDKREGQSTGSIQTASNRPDKSLINNVSFVAKEPESDSAALKLDLLVVDVNNEYKAADT